MRLEAIRPYRDLLRHNPDFRRLWAGQIVSQLGDWFCSIAIYSLLLERTGRGESVAWAILAQLVPFAILGPPAGVIADRLDRKKILIVTDLLRAIVVAGLILAERSSGTTAVYALLLLQVSLSSFFEPAKSALVPAVTRREDWLAANTLSGMTWSVMLAVGASVGGAVAAIFGRQVAFAVDSMTFLVSALLLRGIAPRGPGAGGAPGWLSPVADLGEGFRRIRRFPGLAATLLVKSAWGVGGGVILLYSIFGSRVFPAGKGAAASIGLLFAARGIGAAIGPLLGRALLGGDPPQLRRNIAVGFVIAGLFVIAFARAPSLSAALVAVFLSHIGGSMLWVFSTTLLQLSTPDALRGRIFAIEMAGVTVTMSLSSLATGWAIDHEVAGPRGMAVALGGYFVAAGLLWYLLQRAGRGHLDAAILSADER